MAAEASKEPTRRRDLKEETKGGWAASDSSEEVSLTRVKESAGSMANYKVVDGEFKSFPEINQKSADLLTNRGIKNLFPIQQHTFYPIYNREDVIARDLTGSGKTLAFALPVTEYLRKNQILGSRRISAIVLAPTRELAIQVSKNKKYEFGAKEQSLLDNFYSNLIFASSKIWLTFSAIGPKRVCQTQALPE